jgi:hypothetical protein
MLVIFYLHFTEKETAPQMVCHVPKIEYILKWRTENDCRQLDSNPNLLHCLM